MTHHFSIPEAAKAFDCFARPPTYVEDDLYESERDEYEEMLGGKRREELVATDFGTVAWGPLCFLTPEAMAYLLPRLMELAASNAKDKSGELFMMRFINRFSDGPSGTEYSLLTEKHRTVVHDFLKHISSDHHDLVAEHCWEDVLAEAIESWRPSPVSEDDA